MDGTAPSGANFELRSFERQSASALRPDTASIPAFTFGEVCAGISAASVAWKEFAEPKWFSEIEAFPSTVLAHHHHDVPNHGDFTRIIRDPELLAKCADVDVLIGGCPCQDFSISGLRASLTGDRGNLTLEFLRLVNAIDDLRQADGRGEVTVVYENVPGLLSVGDNAFGAFLGGLAGHDAAIPYPSRSGWTDAGVVAGPRRRISWRVLDAQFFGLAQRRRRVFVVAQGHSRGWAAPDSLLPIIDSLQWHSAPRRETGKVTAGTLAARTRGGGGLGTDFELGGGLVEHE
jgi:DNA (cytosine-5)-methyltransferase 1